MLSTGRAPAVGKDFYWSQTVMLLSGEGANNSTTFTDSSLTARTMTTSGNAKISTTQFKYGSSSMAFDGSGDYAVQGGGTASTYAFGTGDFTIEAWIYATNFTGGRIIFDCRPASTNGIYPTLFCAATGSLQFITDGVVKITGSVLSTSTWYHVAVCRMGTDTKLFIDGTQTGSTYSDTNSYLNTVTNRPVIGASGFNLSLGWNGYIDDLRVTKGAARYTNTFTAPTVAHPARG
jgi:hypothetical protein